MTTLGGAECRWGHCRTPGGAPLQENEREEVGGLACWQLLLSR